MRKEIYCKNSDWVKNSSPICGTKSHEGVGTDVLNALENSNVNWFCSDDAFKNKKNFTNGIRHITELASAEVVSGCMKLLDQMIMFYEEEEEVIAPNISFFCEVGVWDDSETRLDNFYDENFSKYLADCMHTWFYGLFDF